MANNPKLLIADEPTGNLDPDTSWDIAQILYKINNWGTTVLMATHGSDIVNSMHKRVIRLKSGVMVRDDFKGSYEDVDEYSMKIIESQQEKTPVKVDTNTEKKEKGKETKKTESKKSKLKQSSKKISFSTKKNSAPAVNLANKDDESFEEKILEEIDTEEVAPEATNK
jgi:ABC-type multidrug transport system ATPase subunit